MKLFWQTKQFHNKTIMWQMKNQVELNLFKCYWHSLSLRL